MYVDCDQCQERFHDDDIARHLTRQENGGALCSYCASHRTCELCGESMRDGDRAEMYRPAADGTLGDGEHVMCHPECGIARDYEVA